MCNSIVKKNIRAMPKFRCLKPGISKKLAYIKLAALLLFSPLLFAMPETESNNLWQCTVHDSQGKSWSIVSLYELTAMNKALDACKKASLQPLSCRSHEEGCDLLFNGESTRSLWKCTALDAMSKVWRSRACRQRDKAALAAKAFCQRKSTVPDTCYVYLTTCKNLSTREP